MFHVKHSLPEALAAYKDLLNKYHATLDLMSDQALGDIDRKIAESLSYVRLAEKFASNPLTVLDVGSGGGLPAIPMALAQPRWRFHLVERRQRRAAFLRLVKSQLGLENVFVHAKDVRDVVGIRVALVSALAVGTFEKLYCETRHLHEERITLLSRKGDDFRHEVAVLEARLGHEAVEVVAVPANTHGKLVAVVVAGGSVCRS